MSGDPLLPAGQRPNANRQDVKRQGRIIIRRKPTIIGTKYNVRTNAVDPSSPGRSAPASAMLVKSSCVDIVLAEGGGRFCFVFFVFTIDYNESLFLTKGKEK